MMNDELKPCPFCGNPAMLYDNCEYGGKISDVVQCPACEVETLLTPAEWNNRPLEDALRSRIAALEAERDGLRAEIERLHQPYTRLSYEAWSKMEDDQDWRGLAYAFEDDARAVHDELAQARAQLAAALRAAQWEPVDAGFGIRDTGVDGLELSYWEDGAKRYIGLTMPGMGMAFDLPPDYAFCRRNPNAAVWRPVADGQHGGVNVSQNGSYLDQDGDEIQLPIEPTQRLCELVTAPVQDGDA